MRTNGWSLILASLFLALPPAAGAEAWLDRLPSDVLAVDPPSSRVSGVPGSLRIERRDCRSLPLDGVRRRIVNTAIQEWAFFGFGILDQTGDRGERRRWRRRIGPDLLADDLNRRSDDELLPVVTSVGGYWSVTPDGPWMLERQNRSWQGPWGYRADWRDHWSAAFISWVMCESGLGEMAQFERSIAHHDYIDQAILARDDANSPAAYLAYDVGETAISAGDLLCRGNRPRYANLAARRAQLHQGARTHCDIVVQLDEAAGEIWAIGGNVVDSVRLKRLPAALGRHGLQPLPYGGRQIFAHLRLKAPPLEATALDNSPTMAALGCRLPSPPLLLAGLVPPAAAESC